jgi:uncharacterized protein (DUF433 family)
MNILDLRLPDFLERDGDGSIRVTGHRVSLPLIMDAIESKKDLNEIAEMYPTISPQKLRQVVTYCEDHADDWKQYTEQEKAIAEELETEFGQRGPSRSELLERLASRRQQRRPE